MSDMTILKLDSVPKDFFVSNKFYIEYKHKRTDGWKEWKFPLHMRYKIIGAISCYKDEYRYKELK